MLNIIACTVVLNTVNEDVGDAFKYVPYVYHIRRRIIIPGNIYFGIESMYCNLHFLFAIESYN